MPDITAVAQIKAPAALRSIKCWLTWKFEPHDNPGGKPRKVPWYAGGGRRYGDVGSPEDRRQLVTFDDARAAAARRGHDGVGFALLPDSGIVALDFDNCVDDQGSIIPEVLDIAATSYSELSPSGHGVRCFFQGDLGNRKSSKGWPFGFETFSSSGYVTFTGRVLEICSVLGNEDIVAPVNQEVQALYHQRFSQDTRLENAFDSDLPPVGLSTADLERALASLPDDLDYDDWLTTGMAVHHETSGEGFELWHEWSSASPKYTSREYCRDRWRSFDRATGPVVTARSLVHMARERGLDIGPGAAASPADFDDVADQGAAEGAPAAGAKRSRFTPVAMADFVQRAPMGWLVKGVLPKAGLVVLYGQSGSGKSFAALDIAAAVARGLPWRGRRVRQGRVVYVCAEGAVGFQTRCLAYLQHNNLPAGDLPLEVIPEQPNVLQKDEALALAKAIGQASMVILDTFAQVTAGGNENAGEDMGKALAHCAGIHRATGALVLLVHHSGKDESKGARGWSGIRAAADAELEVTKMLGGGRQIRTSKMKDGADDLVWGFALEPVSLGLDSDGDPVTSCVVVEAEVPTAKALSRPLGAKERIVVEVIQEMAQAQTTGLEVNEIVKQAVARLEAPADGKRDTRRQHIRRALEALCQGDEASYWLHEDGTLDVV